MAYPDVGPAADRLHLVLPPCRTPSATGGTTHPLVRRLAAGYLECLVLQKSASIVALWPTPQALLDDRGEVVQVMIDHFQEAATAAGPLARAAVHNALQEAVELPEGPDEGTAAGYADAILQRLEWDRGPRAFLGGAEVHDIETLRLIRLARRGAFDGASFADDNGDDVA